MTSTINASTTAGVVTTADTSGVLALQTAGTTAVTISAAQVATFTNPITGALNGTVGATTANTGAFTTISSTGTITAGSTNGTITTGNGTLSLVSTGGNDVFINVGTTRQTIFQANSVEVARLTSSAAFCLAGASTSPGGTGIAFPATQNASANANTLDDYEEGTWTPTLTGDISSTGIIYSGQVGRYIKIGKLVTVDISLTLSAKTAIVGTVIITGIPFSANTSPNTALTWGYWANFATNWVSVGGWINAGNIIYLGGRKTAGAGIQTMVDADIATISEMNFSITYVAA